MLYVNLEFEVRMKREENCMGKVSEGSSHMHIFTWVDRVDGSRSPLNFIYGREEYRKWLLSVNIFKDEVWGISDYHLSIAK